MAVIGIMLWFILKWVLIIAWRFFSGNFMNAREYNDATWWKNASRKYQKMRRKYTWWNRKCRVKRMAWRNCIFWPVLWLVIGFMVDAVFTLFVIGIMAPGLFLIVRKRIRLAFYLPIVAHESDGSVRQHWVMKPKIRRIIDTILPPDNRRRRPGLAMESELRGPAEWPQEPMQYNVEVVGNELDGQPTVELKLLMEPDDVFE